MQKCGFIIVCKDNQEILKTTINSLEINYPGSNYVIVSENKYKHDEKILSGGKDLISCINTGINNSKDEWNMVINKCAWIKESLIRKYSSHITNEKDILFCAANFNPNFVDNNLNGLMLNKKTFRNVGCFSENNNFETSKLLWAINAIERGYKFKGIITKI